MASAGSTPAGHNLVRINGCFPATNASQCASLALVCVIHGAESGAADLPGHAHPKPRIGNLRITGAGAPLTRDIRFYAQWLARHERSHLKEMARVSEAVSQ